MVQEAVAVAKDQTAKFFSKEGFLNKRGVGVILGIIILIVAACIPGSDAISHEGIMSIGALLFAVVFWVCGVLPVGVTGLLALVICVLAGAATMKTAFGAFGSNVIWFIVAIFALPALLTKTNWPVRLINKLFKLTGDSSEKLVLVFMIGAAIVSTVMSDTAAVVLFVGIAFVILRSIDAQPGKSNLGKALMIGIPVGAVIGGVVTPAGSSFNMLALGMMQQATGQTISFLEWIIIGLPVAIISIPLCWFSIVKILKPEKIDQIGYDNLRKAGEEAGKSTTFEKRALFMILILPVLWIVGSFVPVLNTTTVAIIGLAIMFLPGVNLLEWKEYVSQVPWPIILMMGSVMSLGDIVAATGAAQFVTDAFLSTGVAGLDLTLFLLVCVVVVYLLHTIAPAGAAILSLFLPIMIGVCASYGISPAVPTTLLAFIVAGNFILPVNPTVLITFGEGYFTFGDMAKSGIIPAVIFCVVMVLWVPFICGVMGI